ncbi:MAG: hypothetical protein JNM79_01655 [Burkholderiales bacterium]|nr:hypothetical protein [Burkholderiales bacterium]
MQDVDDQDADGGRPADVDIAIAGLPPGPARDELVRLVAIARKFTAQQCGRRPGTLAKYMQDLLRNEAPPGTFAELLLELERQAILRDQRGPQASPIERVNRAMETVTYHAPGSGARRITFKTLRNHYTAAKNILLVDSRGA